MKNAYEIVRKKDISITVNGIELDFVSSFEASDEKNVENFYSFGEERPFAGAVKSEKHTLKISCVNKIDLFKDLSDFTLSVCTASEKTMYENCNVISKKVSVKNSENNITIDAVIQADKKG